jgi:hypothetical protein
MREVDMLDKYKTDIINFSSDEVKQKGFLSLLTSVFKSPIYLCRDSKPFNTEFEYIKDYVFDNITEVNENSVMDVCKHKVIPIVFLASGDDVSALIISSDDCFSIVISRDDVSSVIEDLSSKLRYKRK